MERTVVSFIINASVGRGHIALQQDKITLLSWGVSQGSTRETDQLERERCMKRLVARNWLRRLGTLLGKSSIFRASSQTGTLGRGLKLLSTGRTRIFFREFSAVLLRPFN